jgi:hypothetical protein
MRLNVVKHVFLHLRPDCDGPVPVVRHKRSSRGFQ